MTSVGANCTNTRATLPIELLAGELAPTSKGTIPDRRAQLLECLCARQQPLMNRHFAVAMVNMQELRALDRLQRQALDIGQWHDHELAAEAVLRRAEHLIGQRYAGTTDQPHDENRQQQCHEERAKKREACIEDR